MYKRILLTHAGTEAGDDALKHAIHIATPSCSQIHILHVIEKIPTQILHSMEETKKEKIQREIDDVCNIMKNYMTEKMLECVKACKEEDVAAKYEILVGDPASEIISAIHRHKTDLIVMAKKRKFSENKILKVGGITRKVLEEARCPALIIDSEN